MPIFAIVTIVLITTTSRNKNRLEVVDSLLFCIFVCDPKTKRDETDISCVQPFAVGRAECFGAKSLRNVGGIGRDKRRCNL